MFLDFHFVIVYHGFMSNRGTLNTRKLNKLIESSGMKKQHIAKELEIVPTRFSEKINGRVFMYPSELIQTLRVIGFDDVSLRFESLVDWYTLTTE